MIEPDKRKAIYLLHQNGMSIREISRRLGVSRNSISSIIGEKGSPPPTDTPRKDKLVIDEQLLRQLYSKCNGWIERIHEILTEEKGINVGYSTLTRMIRELELGKSRYKKYKRCHRVPDKPGEEMQHDTTIYTIKIGDKPIRMICSILYFRYSKVRYVKFYRSFNRFKMKCFLHEALIYFGYTAWFCIIDNTNLARLRGSGKNAIIIPEMEQFAKQYGFVFVCHEIGHANRKAGNERSFYTLESNFFPGRTFESLEDLNQQAFEWATKRMANRPVSKTSLIPAKAFEHEQSYLNRLPPYVEPPYIVHERTTDQYGYISFDGNFYWIPGTRRDDVRVLQYGEHIKIHHNRVLLVQYQLPPEGVKNQVFSPPGKTKPLFKPEYRKKPSALEEKKLRGTTSEVDDYLNFVLKQIPDGKPKHRFIRQLYSLYQKLALPLFIKTIQRALKYRITDINTIERICLLLMKQGNYQLPLSLSVVTIDKELHRRESYLEGKLSDEVDLSIYDKILDNDNDNDNDKDKDKDNDKDKEENKSNG